MASFKLFGNLKPLIGDTSEAIELDSTTVREAVAALIERFPDLVGELVNADDKELNRYYSILVNGEMIEFLNDLDTKLTSEDEVTIFPPTAA